MRVALVDIAILQWAIRLVSWSIAIIEMGIVVSGSNLGPYRGSWGPAMTTPALGLFILPFLLIMWGKNDEFGGDEPMLEVRASVGYDAPTESWLAQFRRGMLKKGFLREQRLPVPKWYLISYSGILFLDTIVFLLWITDLTIFFPWKKDEIVAQLLAVFPGDMVRSWSSVSLPHLILEFVNCVLFTMVYIAGWILVLWLFILRWQKARFVNARVQPPMFRRAVLPVATPFQEHREQPQETDNSPNIIRHTERKSDIELAVIPGEQRLNINEEEKGTVQEEKVRQQSLEAEQLPGSVRRHSPDPDLVNALPLLAKSSTI